MKLSLWNYENTSFIGVINVAKSLKNAGVILTAPSGDGYVNVILSMFKRFLPFSPVHLCPVGREELSVGMGGKIRDALDKHYRDKRPDILFLVTSCTAELLKVDMEETLNWARKNIPVPVLAVGTNSFSEPESESADRTMLELLQMFARRQPKTSRPSVNLIGPAILGFHEQSNIEEMFSLLTFLGIDINSIFPWKADIDAIARIPSAWANVTWNFETAGRTLEYLHSSYGIPCTKSIPVGELGVRKFIDELSSLLSVSSGNMRKMPEDILAENFGISSYDGRVANFRNSINAEQLRRKKAFVFGSYTQAAGAARFLHTELRFPVACAGTYSAGFEDKLRAELADLPIEVFASADFLEVRKRIAAIQPDLILGTQMERHISTELGIPCVLISCPVHLETFPLGFEPFIGLRGASHLADIVSAPMNLGLEDDLKKMFQEDDTEILPASGADDLQWDEASLAELKKIPFFVRNKAKGVIEEYARKKGISLITVEVMYKAREEMT